MTVSTDAYFCFICSSFSSAMSPPNEHRAALVSWARSIEWMPGAGIDYVCFSTLAPGRLDRCAHGGEPFGFALPGAALVVVLSGAPDQLFCRGRRSEGELQLQSLMASVLIDNRKIVKRHVPREIPPAKRFEHLRQSMRREVPIAERDVRRPVLARIMRARLNCRRAGHRQYTPVQLC